MLKNIQTSIKLEGTNQFNIANLVLIQPSFETKKRGTPSHLTHNLPIPNPFEL